MKFKPELFAITNTGIGLVVAVLLTHFVLPLFGYPAEWTKDIAVTLIYTGASLIRNDIIYRIFNGGHSLSKAGGDTP